MDTLDTIIAEMRWIASRCGTLPDGDPYARPDSRDLREWADRLAALQREPVAWMTHHDYPMLLPTRDEAGAYCDDDEEPIPLYAAPPAPAAPEGWQLVPVEPTQKMLSGLIGPSGYCSIPLADAYRAMLAAAKENTSE